MTKNFTNKSNISVKALRLGKTIARLGKFDYETIKCAIGRAASDFKCPPIIIYKHGAYIERTAESESDTKVHFGMAIDKNNSIMIKTSDINDLADIALETESGLVNIKDNLNKLIMLGILYNSTYSDIYENCKVVYEIRKRLIRVEIINSNKLQ